MVSPLPASYVTLHRSCRPCHPRLTATGKQRQTPQKKFPPSLSLRLLMLKAHICLKIFLGYKLWSKKPEALSVISLFPFHSNPPQTSRHVAEGSQRQTSEKYAKSSHS